MKVDIWGCCFSRDSIAFQNNSRIVVNNQIHYSSIFSIVQECILPSNLFVGWQDMVADHNFVKRNIYLDLYKLYFQYVNNNKSEWCIVDFGNIRHNLLKITRVHDGAYQYVTASNESRRSIELLKDKLNDVGGYVFENIDIADICDRDLEQSISSFINRLEQMYDMNKIIVLDGRACKYYLDSTGGVKAFIDDSIDRINTLYERAYGVLRKLYPKMHYIPSLDKNLGYEYHKWNKFCLHYIHQTYDYYYESLNSIIFGDNNSSKIERITQEISNIYDNAVYNTIKRMSSSESVFQPSIEYGGISGSSYYNTDNGELNLTGWFLPTYAYDEIDVFIDSQMIGQCTLKIERIDVEKNYSWDRTALYSGFAFKKTITCDSKNLTLVVKNKGEVVKSVNRALSALSRKV